MSGVNKVILLGRLGRDPEVRQVSDGATVANFSIATSDKWKDKTSGEVREKTEWHRIVAWNKLGEICKRFLSKGRQVYVEGKLSTRSWEQEGQTRYITEIIANDIRFVGSRNNIKTDYEFNNEENYDNSSNSSELEEKLKEVPF